MTTENFTWIPTHKAIAEYLLTQENNQKGLIKLLKSAGINSFSDKDEAGTTFDLVIFQLNFLSIPIADNKYSY